MPPKRLSRDAIDAIVSAVANGVPYLTACKALGIPTSTAFSWQEAAQTGAWQSSMARVEDDTLELLEELRTRVISAEAEFETRMIESISQAGFDRNEKTGQRDWRAHAWLANNAPQYRQTYRQERVTLSETQGNVRHEHVLVRQLSDQELRKALSQPEDESSQLG